MIQQQSQPNTRLTKSQIPRSFRHVLGNEIIEAHENNFKASQVLTEKLEELHQLRYNEIEVKQEFYLASDSRYFIDTFSFRDHCQLIEYFGGQVYSKSQKDIHHIQVVPFNVDVTKMNSEEFKHLMSCYFYGKIYSFNLVIKAIQDGRIPEDRDQYLAFTISLQFNDESGIADLKNLMYSDKYQNLLSKISTYRKNDNRHYSVRELIHMWREGMLSCSDEELLQKSLKFGQLSGRNPWTVNKRIVEWRRSMVRKHTSLSQLFTQFSMQKAYSKNSVEIPFIKSKSQQDNDQYLTKRPEQIMPDEIPTKRQKISEITALKLDTQLKQDNLEIKNNEPDELKLNDTGKLTPKIIQIEKSEITFKDESESFLNQEITECQQNEKRDASEQASFEISATNQKIDSSYKNALFSESKVPPTKISDNCQTTDESTISIDINRLNITKVIQYLKKDFKDVIDHEQFLFLIDQCSGRYDYMKLVLENKRAINKLQLDISKLHSDNANILWTEQELQLLKDLIEISDKERLGTDEFCQFYLNCTNSSKTQNQIKEQLQYLGHL